MAKKRLIVRNSQVKGFWAACDYTLPEKPIKSIGFRKIKGKVVTGHKLVITADVYASDSNLSEFDAFLLTLYNSGIQLTGKAGRHDLTKSIREAGLIDFDTWGEFRKADRTDIFKTVNISEWADRLRNKSTIINFVKHLGLSGLIHHLFAGGAITWKQFLELVLFFYPSYEQRSKYFVAMNTVLRAKNILLTPEEVKEILIEDDGTNN